MGCGGSKKADDVADPSAVTLEGGAAPPAKKPVKAPSAGQLAKQKAEEERLEKAQAAAAVKVQARARGAKGRAAAVAERAKYPCKQYRVNVAAENFGDCLCGFPKAEHKASAFEKNTAEPARAKRVNSADAREKMMQKEKVACKKYVVNMESANFGECVCGAKRDDHTAEALAAGTKGGPKHGERDSAEVRAGFVQKEFVECKKYVVNMESANFGECVCGAKRDDHSPAALAAATKGGPKHGQRNSADVRGGFLQKEYCACEKYVVNMESANFGECVCGEPRDHHSPEALGNATKGGPKHGQRNSADVREGFLQKETVSCTNFVLDMSPDALFGQCVNCGQPRNKHSDAALKGAPADVGAPGALAKEASKYTSQDVLEVAEPPKPAKRLSYAQALTGSPN